MKRIIAVLGGFFLLLALALFLLIFVVADEMEPRPNVYTDLHKKIVKAARRGELERIYPMLSERTQKAIVEMVEHHHATVAKVRAHAPEPYRTYMLARLEARGYTRSPGGTFAVMLRAEPRWLEFLKRSRRIKRTESDSWAWMYVYTYARRFTYTTTPRPGWADYQGIAERAEKQARGELAHIEWNIAAGEEARWDELGALLDGQRNYEWVRWHDNGRLRAKGEYADGEEYRDWTFWKRDGSRFEAGPFYRGKKNGVWKRYGADGAVKSTRYYMGHTPPEDALSIQEPEALEVIESLGSWYESDRRTALMIKVAKGGDLKVAPSEYTQGGLRLSFRGRKLISHGYSGPRGEWNIDRVLLQEETVQLYVSQEGGYIPQMAMVELRWPAQADAVVLGRVRVWAPVVFFNDGANGLPQKRWFVRSGTSRSSADVSLSDR